MYVYSGSFRLDSAAERYSLEGLTFISRTSDRLEIVTGSGTGFRGGLDRPWRTKTTRFTSSWTAWRYYYPASSEDSRSIYDRNSSSRTVPAVRFSDLRWNRGILLPCIGQNRRGNRSPESNRWCAARKIVVDAFESRNLLRAMYTVRGRKVG